MTTKKERAAALKGMTKAELIRTINTLDKRQTVLLNQIAALTQAEQIANDATPVTRSQCHEVLEATKTPYEPTQHIDSETRCSVPMRGPKWPWEE